MTTRDRDPRGRARNARPRDAAGRPLAHGAPGVERVPEDLVLAPVEALAEAQRLLDEGLPFQAHEVLEGAWKATTGVERTLWQGLAQLAVGLTHAQRRNATGAVSLLERGAERIGPFATEPPHGVDVAGLSAHATALASRIRATGLASVTSADLRPQLRGRTPPGAATR
ncbi:MAG TPA: DUF309 domain-containing protein [Pseudonocardia sp.]|uniref:DUF309 domain-containing protein n=1 Tax=Pseudonocardia sp. TaxID=60912 RepID=UPI002BCFD8A5|nr:DUF309 domain-containing protein [Pseudonocardia sp.]HTF52436.1 DUF309 domain-containing protein [Pseudonocardia sp.]